MTKYNVISEGAMSTNNIEQSLYDHVKNRIYDGGEYFGGGAFKKLTERVNFLEKVITKLIVNGVETRTIDAARLSEILSDNSIISIEEDTEI